MQQISRIPLEQLPLLALDLELFDEHALDMMPAVADVARAVILIIGSQAVFMVAAGAGLEFAL